MGAAYRPGRADGSGSVATEPLVERSPCVPSTVKGGQGGAGCAAMPVPDRQLGDEFAPPEPKRCRHCDESRSCGAGDGAEGEERTSWRVTLDHDLVETLSAIYPEWFKQPRRDRSPITSPSPLLASPNTPATSPEDDIFSSGAEDMASRQACSSGASEPPSSPPRVSPPKVVVDDSPLQPAMGKHKESLKVKLMMRRPINQLVAQGIMPPLKTPPAYFKQSVQLARAKTGDLLKAKIQSRPNRQELERRHILEQESHVDPSLAEKQRMLKKARLADQLNDQLSHRPGPLELIKKNILHTEENIETAVKSGSLAFKATSEGASGRPQHPSSYCGPPEEISPSPSPPSTYSPASVSICSTQHPAPGKVIRRKPKTKEKCKSRFKFHEYKGPPNAQKSSSPPGSDETPYELLLQQQQLLLQLMLPASPAPSSTSIASDSSDALPPPPPPPLPVSGNLANSRFEDMKVSDLRAECKRRNLRVSGPKPQLIDRLRPYLMDMLDDSPTSPVSVTSPESKPDPESEDIVQSQRRLIDALERQLEAVRRDAAGASGQSRRLLCLTQLKAKLHALQQSTPPAPPQRYVIATPDTAPDRLVRLFTVTPPTSEVTNDNQTKTNSAYILNGVVPIAILPTHFEPEQAPPPPPPPPLPPPPPMPQTPMSIIHDSEDSQIMDDVLEILAENGELPSSAVGDVTSNRSIDTGYLTASPGDFTPTDVLTDDVLNDSHVRDSLAADELQRELNEIQNEIMGHDLTDIERVDGIDHDLNVDMLATNEFNANFADCNTTSDNDFLSLLTESDDTHAMDIDDEQTEMMSIPPLTNDILDTSRTDLPDINDLSLPFHNEDTRHDTFEDRCDFDFKEFDLGNSVNMDSDYNVNNNFPNLFGRGHMPPCDPLLGGILSRPAPRPACKIYSWEKSEYDAT